MIRKSSFDRDPFEFLILLFIIFFALMLVGRAITTQQVLNQECKTNYNFIQVVLAGDNLTRLCLTKNQQITIK